MPPTDPRPLVGVSMCRQTTSWWAWERDAALVPGCYLDMVERAGAQPVLIGRGTSMLSAAATCRTRATGAPAAVATSSSSGCRPRRSGATCRFWFPPTVVVPADAGWRALRMTREVRAGNLSVNSNSPVRVQTSFGAMERSGCGPELGSEGSEGSEALASYAEVKNVFVATDR